MVEASTRLSRALFIGLILVYALLPLFLGGNRDFVWPFALALTCLLMAGVQIGFFLNVLAPSKSYAQTRWFRLGLWLWFAYGVLQWIPLGISRSDPGALALAEQGLSPSWSALSLDPFASFKASLKTLLYVQLACLTLLLLNSWQRIKILLYLLIAIATVQAAVSTFMVVQDLGYRSAWFAFAADRAAASGSYINRNHFAGYLELHLAMAIGLMVAGLRSSSSGRSARQLLRDIVKLLLSGKTPTRLAIVVMVVGLVMTGSRMGNVAFLSSLLLSCALALILLRKPPRSLWIFAISMLIIDVVVIGSWFGVDRVAERLATTRIAFEAPAQPSETMPAAEASDGTSARAAPLQFEVDRAEVSKATLAMWRENPWFGNGGGSFRSLFPAVRTAATSASFYDHAHNDFAQLLAEYGVIGATLAASLVLSVLWRVLVALRLRRDRRMQGLGLACLMGVLSLLIHGVADFNLQIPGNAALFTLLLSLGMIASTVRFARQTVRTPSHRPLSMALCGVVLVLVAPLLSAQEVCPDAASTYEPPAPSLSEARERQRTLRRDLPANPEAIRSQLAGLLVVALNQSVRADALDKPALATSWREFAAADLKDMGWRVGQLAKSGAAEPNVALGEMRRLGLIIEKDLRSSCRAFRAAALVGNPDGAYRAALCATETGREMALAAMQNAAQIGHPIAQEALGTLCLKNEPPDLSCAAFWFCRASNQGLNRATVLAAWLLSEERSPIRDVNRSLALYERAARAGDASAQNNLAEIYERGWLGIVDMPRAMELYAQASNQGLAPAQLNLARLLLRTSEAGSAKRREAMRWLAASRSALPAQAQAMEVEFGLIGR